MVKERICEQFQDLIEVVEAKKQSMLDELELQKHEKYQDLHQRRINCKNVINEISKIKARLTNLAQIDQSNGIGFEHIRE